MAVREDTARGAFQGVRGRRNGEKRVLNAQC
jgi:hypothetical protein